MHRVLELVQAVAPGRTTVLMTGESGTGKSLIARAIHDSSPRRSEPFVEVSCGSLPEALLESELFGHVKGAFTGAHADKTGRFLAAHRGTIFLDEINSASAAMQLKLLRAVQERKFEPVGSSRTVETDVRIILASNEPLERLVADGRFRQDLYYRINVISIELPPLRERREDIAVLAHEFLRRQASELGRQITGLAPDALAALQRYAFPGNVRELQNIMERAAVLAKQPTITLGDLPEHVAHPGSRTDGHEMSISTRESGPHMTLAEALRAPERGILIAALHAHGWNRQLAAKQLGIDRTTLYKKMKLHGIDGQEKAA
jgi:transcriptional regulator with PAS, ATPase and Fis domain